MKRTACFAFLLLSATGCASPDVADDAAPRDAGRLSDAGRLPDAGRQADAGRLPDAGLRLDAGVFFDAGLLADAGAPQRMPDFSLPDVNPASPTFEEQVSPRDQVGRVTAWYFGHST